MSKLYQWASWVIGELLKNFILIFFIFITGSPLTYVSLSVVLSPLVQIFWDHLVQQHSIPLQQWRNDCAVTGGVTEYLQVKSIINTRQHPLPAARLPWLITWRVYGHTFLPQPPTILLGNPNFRIFHIVSWAFQWADCQLSSPPYPKLPPPLPFYNIHSKNLIVIIMLW